MNTVILPGDRVLVRRHVNGFARKPYRATVIEWTPRGKLKVKKGVDDRTVIVSPEDAKKLADGKMIDVSPPPDKAPETVIIYLPEKV